MDSGKTSSYIKYAIGEIILVVIGILIALQINNWNDTQKEKAELKDYLSKISNNIETDIVILDSIKTKSITMNKICSQALQNYMTNDFDINLGFRALEAFIDTYFTPNTSGYDALKSSTYLGKINGTTVDSLLDAYNNLINRVVKEEVSYFSFVESMEVLWTEKHDMPELFKVYMLAPDQREALFKNPEFINSVAYSELKKAFMDNSFKAVVSRTAGQTQMIADYEQLIALGKESINTIAAYNNE
jgi:hypothetical protein